MAPLMGSRRRAEQFAALVDGLVPAEQAPADLRDLVDVIDTMRSVEVPVPRPAFSAELRERLMVEAQTALVPVSPLVLPPRRRGGRERRLTAAAAIFTLVGGTAGMAAAAQDALPGEALYPIKRGIEDARLGVQSAPADRGRTYLEQAADRLTEAELLVAEEASSTTVEQTVDSFVVQAVAGADLLLAAYQDGQESADVEVLRTFTSDALEQLQELAKAAPSDVQDELARAAVVLQRIDQQAAAACSDCSDLPALEMPVLMAQAAEISRAMTAMREQRPDNDHPPIGATLPQASTRPDSGGQASDGTTAPQLGGGDPGAEVPSLGVESSGELPGSPQQALKDLDDATGGLLGKVGTKTGETTKQLGDGLSDAVEDTLGDTGVSGTE